MILTLQTLQLNYLDCYEVYQKFNKSPGVYPIQVDIQTIVNTYCLEEGWTVIQSRGQYGNPSDYFFKTSAEYKDGFGKPGNQVCVVVFLCLFFE